MLKTVLEIIAAAVVAGLIPAFMARATGRSFIFWWVYGTVLFPLALPHAIIRLVTEDRKACMYCRRMVSAGARTCPKCGYEFIDLG